MKLAAHVAERIAKRMRLDGFACESGDVWRVGASVAHPHRVRRVRRRGRGGDSVTIKPDWFREIWDALSDEERTAVQDKAAWEHMSLRAVMADWPSLVPEHLRHLVPPPDRSA